MTKEDIIRMAREAELYEDGQFFVCKHDELERFARLVYEATFRDANIAASKTILDAAVLEEREACAKVCEQLGEDSNYSTGRVWGRGCAAAIRARSKE